MRQVYARKWTETVTASHSKYVFSDRVDPGRVLHVYNCFAHAPDRGLSEIIQLGVRSGGQDVLLRSRAGAIAKEGMSALNEFFVGEGDQVFAYFPASDEGDTIELDIIGVLYYLKDWRKV